MKKPCLRIDITVDCQMPVYPNSEILYKVIKSLFDRIKEEETKAIQSVLDTRMVFILQLTSPSAVIFIDGKKKPLKITYGDNGRRADLDLQIPADMFHGIMLGTFSLKKIVASGKLKVRGPVWKALALEDVFHRGQIIYPQVLENSGISLG